MSADGRKVALGIDSDNLSTPSASVTILDLRTGRQRRLRADLPSEWIRTIAFTPDGERIAAGTTDTVHVWDVASGQIAETDNPQTGRRLETTVDPRGATVLAGSQDGSVAVFDLSGTRRLGRFFSWNTPEQGCDGPPCQVISPQDIMATDQADGTIALVDLHTLRLTRTLPAREGAIANAIALAPGGRTLVAGGTNRRIVFWDIRTARVTRTLRFGDPVWRTAVSPDGTLLAVQTQANRGANGRVRWFGSAAEGAPIHALSHGCDGVEFTPDGRELVALGDSAFGSTLAAWSTRTGKQLFRRTTDPEAAWAFDLSPHSHLVGVGTANGKLLLLDTRTGKQTGAIPVAAGAIIQVAFSPDGNTFAVGSTDATSSLWDLRSRKRLGNPFPPYPGTSRAWRSSRTGDC